MNRGGEAAAAAAMMVVVAVVVLERYMNYVLLHTVPSSFIVSSVLFPFVAYTYEHYQSPIGRHTCQHHHRTTNSSRLLAKHSAFNKFVNELSLMKRANERENDAEEGGVEGTESRVTLRINYVSAKTTNDHCIVVSYTFYYRTTFLFFLSDILAKTNR